MKWPVVALGEVVEINPAGPRAGEMSEEELADFVPMASVSETGAMSVHERRSYAEVRKGFTIFRNGDVLLAKITPCYENNKIAKAVVTTAYAFGSTEFHVLRPHASKLDADYLTYFLRQDHIRAAGERRMTGSGGQRRVPKAFLEDLEIPLAPLSEQKRIAGILDQADALRRLRALALDRLSALGQAIFQEMFGSFNKGFEGWSTVPMEDVLSEAQIGAVRGSSDMGSDKPIRYLRMDSIGLDGSLRYEDVRHVEATQEEVKRYSLNIGDLLFNTRNSQELVGKMAVVRSEFLGIYNNNILRMRSGERMKSDFVDAFFRTPQGIQLLNSIKSGTTSVFAIYQKALMGLKIPVPPIDEQRIFAERLRAIHLQKLRYFATVQQAEALFSSLQHRAFRGEL